MSMCASPCHSPRGFTRHSRFACTLPKLGLNEVWPPGLRAVSSLLNGKEVHAFSPSSVTVIEGDTIHFVFINPEDDVHSFVLPDFSVALPPQKTTTATYVAKHAGIFAFTCSIPTHLPMMWGELVVLPSRSAPSRSSVQ
jgi:uncharacterized cupredoxin-like copper-binding protein